MIATRRMEDNIKMNLTATSIAKFHTYEVYQKYFPWTYPVLK